MPPTMSASFASRRRRFTPLLAVIVAGRRQMIRMALRASPSELQRAARHRRRVDRHRHRGFRRAISPSAGSGRSRCCIRARPRRHRDRGRYEAMPARRIIASVVACTREHSTSCCRHQIIASARASAPRARHARKYQPLRVAAIIGVKPADAAAIAA